MMETDTPIYVNNTQIESTATSSMVTLEHAWRDKSTTHAYFQQWHMARKHAKNKLATAQTKMERSMLSITYRDRKTNIWVRKRTKVTDVIEQVKRRKWTWAGHVSRLWDNRWTLRITTWKPYERKIPRGRLARRWRDELDDYWKGTTWQRIAQDRQMWKQHAEAFAQPRGR